MENKKRNLEKIILQALEYFPVVGILGSRQCGKTTLAQNIVKTFPNSIYIDLESPSDFNKLQNPEYFFNLHKDKLICLDEIQRKPEIFPILRSVVDKTQRSIRVLVLGSASPELLKQSSESLAGRILYSYLTPFTLNEIFPDVSLETHWLQGGYPLSVLQKSEVSFQWRESFIKAVLERDFSELGFRTSSMQLYRFFVMLAHSSGQLMNKSKLGASLGITHNTISDYLDIFEKTFFIRTLQPYFANTKKRIVKSPKVYIRDSGLLHSLLQIQNIDSLLGNPILGASWEGYCIENIIIKYKDYEPFFYRTANGNEIDLILVKGNHKIAVECKFSNHPKVSSHFYQTLEELEIDEAKIICPIEDSYSIHDKVLITGLNEI